ncbi:nucleolar complex protein 4 homolog B-like [Antedon mediterranea]|uniref:nucleolar complex protein 4 homolog B-like n=1 Tax=Antedon mediterranea TaxID=105859 RepID=UPI003AF77D9C
MCDLKKQLLKGIKSKVEQSLSGKKNSNCIIDILKLTHDADKSIVTAAIKGLSRIFTMLLAKQEMIIKEDEEDKKYKQWLQDRYKDCIQCLIDVIANKNSKPITQELAMCTIVKLLEAESRNPLKQNQGYFFPRSPLEKLLTCLLSSMQDFTHLMNRFQEYLEYDDMRFYTLEVVSGKIRETNSRVQKLDAAQKKMEEELFCKNTLCLLEQVTMPTEDCLSNFLTPLPPDDEEIRATQLKEQRKAFSNAWLSFLLLSLPLQTYKTVLFMMHDKVIPHMSSPVMLTDFLTASYNIGGAISLLALNAIFILMTQHNLEYPEFYKKLYSLLEPSIFHVKYKARFFYLTNLFLSSSHLPAYLVAAFAKKLSSLALTAPPPAVMLVVPFVCNLIKRHPTCKTLIARDTEAMKDDPFLADETDPSKCRALASSLWELKTLKHHYLPSVATTAGSIERPFPKVEWDLTDFYESSYDEMFTTEINKKVKHVPLEFEAPSGLFSGKLDKFNNYWLLE